MRYLISLISAVLELVPRTLGYGWFKTQVEHNGALKGPGTLHRKGERREKRKSPRLTVTNQQLVLFVMIQIRFKFTNSPLTVGYSVLTANHLHGLSYGDAALELFGPVSRMD